MAIILGIDPGSRTTGFGVIEMRGHNPVYIASGCIRCGEGKVAPRLRIIHDGIQQLFGQYQPSEFAIERAFMGKNADSALKLGQARGVAMVVAALHDLEVFEYAPRAIKQAVTGAGGAEKEQVQHMVATLLKLPGCPQADAADALAVALCHGYQRASLIARSSSGSGQRRNWR